MIFLKLENVKPGMFLGRSIYLNNQVLLASNTFLTERYITRLLDLGIPGVYIGNHDLKDLEIKEMISKETQQEALFLAETALTRLKEPEDLNTSIGKKIRQVINKMIQELLLADDLTMNLYNIKTFSDYIFHHSVNVCLFSLMMGIDRSYSEKRLLQLGVGAFLHDLGKLQIPLSILDKPSHLTKEEFNKVKEHPTLGYQILRESAMIDYVSANILYQHHEKLDGTGYPNHLTGHYIHEYARIVAIADIFDAITSKRVYSNAMPNHEAIELLLSYTSLQLDKDLVNLFLSHIPAFPLGTFVQLNNHMRGVVIAQNKGLPLRPILMMIEEEGQEVKPYELNLLQEFSLAIVKTC